MISEILDNGGRRLGFERRQFSYDGYIPDRRSRPERRSGGDRRMGCENSSKKERRAIFLDNNVLSD